MTKISKIGIFSLCMFSLLLSGCESLQKKESDAVDVAVKIPLLLHIMGDNGVDTYGGEWDLSAHTVSEGSLLYRSETAPDAKPQLWDGARSLTIYQEDEPIEIVDETIVVSILSRGSGTAKVLCGPDITISYDDDIDPNPIIYYVDETGDELSSSIPDVPLPDEYGETPKTILYGGYFEGTLYIFYSSYNDDLSASIYCLAFLPGDETGEWSKFEFLQAGASLSDTSKDIVFINGKLYLAANYEIFELDVISGEMNQWTETVELAKSIIPNSTQETLVGGEASIRICGAWDDIILLYLPVYTNDGNSHTLYIAARENKILGAIDITGAGIDVYDSGLNLLQMCLEGTDFGAIPVSLPKTN